MDGTRPAELGIRQGNSKSDVVAGAAVPSQTNRTSAQKLAPRLSGAAPVSVHAVTLYSVVQIHDEKSDFETHLYPADVWGGLGGLRFPSARRYIDIAEWPFWADFTASMTQDNAPELKCGSRIDPSDGTAGRIEFGDLAQTDFKTCPAPSERT
jgi:hypothetical protein